MRKETVTAQMVAPGMYPVVTELYKDENFIQKGVSIGTELLCSIEGIRLGNVLLLYGEEAAVYGAPGNRRVNGRIISGVFYIVGFRKGRITSLDKDDIDRYKEILWEPDEISSSDAVNEWLDRIIFEHSCIL